MQTTRLRDRQELLIHVLMAKIIVYKTRTYLNKAVIVRSTLIAMTFPIFTFRS
jgi:hypothetical protein